MPRVRVHQHVNPLSPHYIQEPRPLELTEIFARPGSPLHLDIGCARGRFLLRMAEARPEWNFLGVEIREPLVTEANHIAREHGLKNLHYEFCNAMLWLGRLLEETAEGSLQMVTIHFPDPWFKKKHAKRRMVNADLVETVVKGLGNDGGVFVQTDIGFLADEIKDLFSLRPELRDITPPDDPFPVKTEREKAVEEKGLPIYRLMFRKN